MLLSAAFARRAGVDLFDTSTRTHNRLRKPIVSACETETAYQHNGNTFLIYRQYIGVIDSTRFL